MCNAGCREGRHETFGLRQDFARPALLMLGAAGRASCGERIRLRRDGFGGQSFHAASPSLRVAHDPKHSPECAGPDCYRDATAI